MGLFNFSTPKPRQFNYRPLYYDERKERLEKMKAQAEAEVALEKKAANYIGLQKGFLTDRRAKSKKNYASHKKASALRFLIILIAILGILYFIAPELFLAFWKTK